jgi:YVTN family beta-propeller protein
VIDTGTNILTNTISNIPSANGITYDGLHNMLWVTNTNNDQVTPIQVNDTATTFTVLDPVTVGDGPWGVVFDSIYGLLYVANSLDNSVSVIDVAQRTVIATLAENFSQPYHLAANPISGKVYVANFGNNTVTVLKDAAVEEVVNLYDSTQPYGIAVDETRSVVYVSTVNANRIVALGTLNGVPDQFLGWSMFSRGYNRQRPLPLRVIAVNPDVGPSYDGGHLWTTTATADGSELNQALLIPKGWSSYFHVPLPQDVSANPTDGIAVDRTNDRVYISSGVSPGIVTVIGDHDNQCAGVAPAATGDETTDFSFNTFSREALFQGDATNDGVINIFDLTFIASRYNSSNYRADVNDDGVIDIFDLAFIASRYGQKIE